MAIVVAPEDPAQDPADFAAGVVVGAGVVVTVQVCPGDPGRAVRSLAGHLGCAEGGKRVCLAEAHRLGQLLLCMHQTFARRGAHDALMPLDKTGGGG